MVKCPECGSEHAVKNGKQGFSQKYKCKDCGNNFLDKPEDSEAVATEEKAVKEEIAENGGTPDAKPKRVLSDKAKNANFRAHYNDTFAETKHSKKYGFDFDSWAEYFAKKHELSKAGKLPKPSKKKAKETAKNESVAASDGSSEDVFTPAE